MKFNFTGKTALVTGAGAGIGKAVAIKFAKFGAKVVLVDQGTGNENANLICFLASDDASYIVGQNILIDGGRKKI